MRRWVAVLWHASFCCIAAALYFVFVLPRWWELMGETPQTLGTVLRIVTGVLIGLAALPVVFTLLRTRRPELGTPALALTLRTLSIALHVLAGVLIIGTAITEIWLSLVDAGQWLFGIYGAAAAIALLGIFAFYLADVAELPPPPPKPLKPKKQKERRGRGKRGSDAEAEDTEASEDTEDTEDAQDSEGSEADEPAKKPAEVTADADEAGESDDSSEKANGKVPDDARSASRRRRRRSRGGVAVQDAVED